MTFSSDADTLVAVLLHRSEYLKASANSPTSQRDELEEAITQCPLPTPRWRGNHEYAPGYTSAYYDDCEIGEASIIVCEHVESLTLDGWLRAKLGERIAYMRKAVEAMRGRQGPPSSPRSPPRETQVTPTAWQDSPQSNSPSEQATQHAALVSQLQYVTLDQAAAMVNRNKKTLERRLRGRTNPLPSPDVEGGGGKPHEWLWSKIRPWLEQEFGRRLPHEHPSSIR